ncbi:MAG TPA: dCTP deaminase [Oligoflexia bacterium]|nr:dCTP deaminase [Oligoflexia bacterium]HMP26774.1 dCTP deaminase [Oligoflexia bacterium]
MMFSNEDIKNAIKTGELSIEPYTENLLKGSGLSLHLGETLLKPLAEGIVDVKNNLLPEYQEIKITMDKPYSLIPGDFVLGHTYQKVTVGAKLGFLIEGRSTLARVGLTIVQTAMMVNPGHKQRSITLEFANHGPNTILLYPKMRIARAAIFELKTPSSIDYDQNGKFKDQITVGKAIFRDEFLEE